MNELSLLNEKRKMSSLEIAALTKKEHSHVLRDIRSMIEELFDDPELDDVENITDNRGYQAEVRLSKNLTLTLVSGYNISLRKRIIDRWQELEAMQKPALPNYQEALRQLADQLDVNAQQQALIEQQKPAVEFVERYVEAKSSKCLSDVAKILKYKPREFIQMLYGDGVIFRRSGVWIPYQQHIDAGRFTVHPGVSAGHAYDQTRVEPDGVVWLAKRYAIPSKVKSKEQA